MSPTPQRLSPRDRVLAALAHRPPDRVPFAWGFGTTAEMGRTMRAFLAAQGLDWGRLWQAAGDTRGVGPAYTGPLPANDNIYLSIFGIRVQPQSYGAGEYQEFTDFPLAGVDDPAVIARYPWPDPADYDYATLRASVLSGDPTRSRATQYMAGNPFEIYCWMTGLEEAMVNLATRPDVVVAALERITGFFEARLGRTLAACGDLVDIVFLADDLGGQTGLLMSRDMYRQIVQPCHRRLTACVRRLAPQAHCMFHSDGAVFDIVPDLLDAGIDVLEAVQTDAAGMEPERLKHAYGDHLSFHGAISVQRLLPFADEPTVARECRRLVAVLGQGGGYVAAPAHAIQAGTPPENVLAMLRAVLGDEDFEAAVRAARRASD